MGRPHFAQALVRHGYVSNNREAFEHFYPRHTPEQQVLYLNMVERYGLHITGGSDFHRERVKPDIQMVALELELDWL